MADKFSVKKRSEIMRAVKSSGSKIEQSLAQELKAAGLSFLRNHKSTFGKPDFVFKKAKVAVFCDSEFWHGYKWKERKQLIKSNRDFWYPKISRNILRDKLVNRTLKADGWKVIRFWEKKILKDPTSCAKRIKGTLKERAIE